MAHPSKKTPKNLYYINTADELVAPAGRNFFSVTSLDGGTIKLKGGGIFEFVDVSELANDDAAAKYIDPLTGLPFASKAIANDASHGDNYYEAISSHVVSVALVAGQTLFGRFTSIQGPDSNTEFIAYS